MLFGLAIGAIAGYCYRKMEEKNGNTDLGEEVNKFTSKAKQKFHDVVDTGKNKMEYMKDRAEYGMKEAKNGIEDITQ